MDLLVKLQPVEAVVFLEICSLDIIIHCARVGPARSLL